MTARDQQDKADRRRLLRLKGYVRSSSGEYRERIVKATNARAMMLAAQRRVDGQPRRISTKRGYAPLKISYKVRRRSLWQRLIRWIKSMPVMRTTFRGHGHR